MKIVLHIFLGLMFTSFILVYCTRYIEFEPVQVKNTTSRTKITHHYENEIHFVESGHIFSNKVLLFIHGSPGNWKAFLPYLYDDKLHKCFHMLAVDRIGYGETTKGMGVQLEKQAIVLENILHNLGVEKEIIVVAHSYGGAVAVKSVLLFPEFVDKLFLIAPCLSPKYQKSRWYNFLLNVFPYNMLAGKDFRNSNKEMLALHEQLSLLEKELETLRLPITVLQGRKDKLVNPKTTDYVRQHYKNAKLKIIEGNFNHFVLWMKKNHVITELLKNG